MYYKDTHIKHVKKKIGTDNFYLILDYSIQ